MDYGWYSDMNTLECIIAGLGKLHEKRMVHRDFHIGNILFMYDNENFPLITDMGLYGEVDNVDLTKIYGDFIPHLKTHW